MDGGSLQEIVRGVVAFMKDDATIEHMIHVRTPPAKCCRNVDGRAKTPYDVYSSAGWALHIV